MHTARTSRRPRPAQAGPRGPRACGARTLVAVALAALSTLALGCSRAGEAGVAASPAAPSTATSAHAAAPATPATPGTQGVDPASARALESLLSRREQALADRDRTRYAATVADPRAPSGRIQLRSFDSAVALDVTGLTHDRAFAEATPSMPDTVVAVLRYRVAGSDTADRSASVTYRLARSRGEWRIATESPSGAGSTAPWLAMPGASVERAEHAIVAGTVAASRLAEYAATVELVRADLDANWTLPGQVLLLAPSSAGEAAVLLGRAAGGAPVAATTEGPLGAQGTATGDRVVLDPDAFATLTAAGRRVVIAHELTHVAVRATVGGTAESWVAEGYADHVGYGYAGLPDSAIAAPLVTAVREDRAPTRLPGAREVDPAAGDIEVAYLASWQAVELLVDRHGEDAVRRFVVTAATAGSDQDRRDATDRALREVLGTTREDLTRDWQSLLRSLGR